MRIYRMDTIKCSKCQIPVQEFITGKKKIDGKVYCKSCYYEELGNLVEEMPMGLFPPLQKVEQQ